jgi:hypothetical protein
MNKKVNKNQPVKRSVGKARAKKPRTQVSVASAPVAIGKTISHQGEPNIKSLGRAGDVIVIHREFISDLAASVTAGAFMALGIPINPGNSYMFPWLSGMASNFESYVFRTLKFFFETDASTSTPGSVLLAVDYDVSDALPADKREFMSFRGATRCPSWNNCVLSCDKEDLHKRKTYYVNNITGNTDGFVSDTVLNELRLDDVGELLVASSNSTSDAVLGELYVEYEVELLTPESKGSDLGYFSANRTQSSTTMTGSYPLGTTALNRVNGDVFYDGLPILIEDDGSNSAMYFGTSGTYLLTISTNTMTTAPTALTITTTSGSTGGSLIDTYNGRGVYGTTSYSYQTVLVVNDHPPTVSTLVPSAIAWCYFSCTGGTWGASASLIFRVVQIPDYDSNQTAGGNVVDLDRPFWCMRKSQRKNRLTNYERPDPAKDCGLVDSLAGNASSDDREKESSSSTLMSKRDHLRTPELPKERGLIAPSKGKNRMRCRLGL